MASHRRFDPIVILAVAVGMVGIIWLGQLVFDQLVFFGDAEQAAQARDSLQIMPAAGGIVLVAAGVLGWRRSVAQAVVLALPVLISLPFAAIGGGGWALIGYLATAPVSIGVAVAAAVPVPRGHALGAAGVLMSAALLVGLGFGGGALAIGLALLAGSAGLLWLRAERPAADPPPAR